MSHAEPLPDPARIVIARRIEWVDTDAAGIYHFTAAMRYAEAAEAALHTELGIVERTFGFTPRVNVSLDFRSSLRFNDPVDIELAVEALGRASARYAVTVSGPQGVAADGHMAICLIDPGTRRSVPWPDDIRELLATAGDVTPGVVPAGGG